MNKGKYIMDLKKQINSLFSGLHNLDEYKVCSKCGKDLPIASFRPQARGTNQPWGHCRACSRKLNNERTRLKKIFGNPPEGYHCPICDISQEDLEKNIKKARMVTPQTLGWVRDHDHKTGKFRGWLCGKCNIALGIFQDDLSIIQKAYNYLESKKE
jgi:hypothetical protein